MKSCFICLNAPEWALQSSVCLQMYKTGCVYIWVPALLRPQSGSSSVCSWSCVAALVGRWAQLNTPSFGSENVGVFFHILHATLTIQVPAQFPKPFERWIYYNTVVIVSLVTCHSPNLCCLLTGALLHHFDAEKKWNTVFVPWFESIHQLLVWNIQWGCVLMMPVSQE